MSELAVRITQAMYRARDAAKILCGKNYPGMMEKFGKVIEAKMKAESKDLLDVTMSLAEEGPPELIIYWTAAAVELIEPSAKE